MRVGGWDFRVGWGPDRRCVFPPVACALSLYDLRGNEWALESPSIRAQPHTNIPAGRASGSGSSAVSTHMKIYCINTIIMHIFFLTFELRPLSLSQNLIRNEKYCTGT